MRQQLKCAKNNLEIEIKLVIIEFLKFENWPLGGETRSARAVFTNT